MTVTVMDGTERGLLRGTCLERVTCLMLGARMFWAELSLRFPRDGPFHIHSNRSALSASAHCAYSCTHAMM